MVNSQLTCINTVISTTAIIPHDVRIIISEVDSQDLFDSLEYPEEVEINSAFNTHSISSSITTTHNSMSCIVNVNYLR